MHLPRTPVVTALLLLSACAAHVPEREVLIDEQQDEPAQPLEIEVGDAKVASPEDDSLRSEVAAVASEQEVEEDEDVDGEVLGERSSGEAYRDIATGYRAQLRRRRPSPACSRR